MKLGFIISLFMCLWSIKAAPQTTVSIDFNQVVSKGYIGNGVQWDPYQGDYGKGHVEISDADWNKLYKRLDYMRPRFIRVMINTISVIKQDKPDFIAGLKQLSKILDYCQSRGVTVIFGDWGNGLVDAKSNQINERNLTFAAEYLHFLIAEKGYSCIKYYNLVNEPNGYWASTDGNYSLWENAIRFFYKQISRLDLNKKLSIIGPDVAIWTKAETNWISRCSAGLKDEIGLYDIHTYPSKSTVNKGIYTDILKAYKEKVPTGKKIVMGELGFKFVEAEDSAYMKENNRRIAANPNASKDDSQMFVYDFMYGTDMADALIQTINAGYSGSIAWMLDDAMHSNEAPEKLKIWGFWNILGDEYFGAEQENIRPWFYAWSLLTRYIPDGSTVFQVNINEGKDVKAVAIEKDGKYTLAVVNVSKQRKNIIMRSGNLNKIKNMKLFVYAKDSLKKDKECGLLPEAKALTLDLNRGVSLDLQGESLTLYTNFDY